MAKKPVYKLKPNGKKATGRPSKYKPEFADQMIEYFESAKPYDIIYKEITTKNGTVIKEPIRVPNDFPQLIDFSISINIHISTLEAWSKDSNKPEFSLAYTRVKAVQKRFLINNGLSGLYNPLFTKFTAINVTDMSDRQEIRVDDATTDPAVLQDKMAKLMSKSKLRIVKDKSA